MGFFHPLMFQDDDVRIATEAMIHVDHVHASEMGVDWLCKQANSTERVNYSPWI